MTLRVPVALHLSDSDAERVRVEHHAKIKELQELPSASMRIISGVSLADSVATPVPHGLGRSPAFVKCSEPRGPTSTGRIEEVRDGTQDRTKVFALKATGWGATIIVDVLVL